MPFMLLVNQRMARPSCNEQGSSTGTLSAQITKWIPALLFNWLSIESILHNGILHETQKTYEILREFHDKLSDSTGVF